VFLLASVALGLLFAVILGGDLARLQSVRFRHAWTVGLALAVQLLLFLPTPFDLPSAGVAFLHSCTYGLLFWFAVANGNIRTLWLVYAGLASNALAILANGGHMPLSAEAARAAEIGEYGNVSESASRLHFLGDVFAIPTELPLANVFSVGDILIGLGAIAFIVLVALDRGEREQALAPSRFLEPLRRPAFRHLALGKLISQSGDWLTFAVLVGWAYERTGSTGQVAAFFLVRLLPPIVGGGFAAHVVDRLPKTRLLVWVELARGALVATALVGVATVNTPLILATFGCSGILAAISAATGPSLVPSLVAGDQLAAANATLGLAKDAAMAFGALGAGVALSSIGPTAALALDLLTFLAASVLFGLLPAVRDRETRASTPIGQSALRYLISSRPLLLLVCSFAIATIATGLTNASLPRLLESLGFGAGGYGFGLGALALGLACGGTLVGFARIGRNASRWIGVALVIMAGLFVVLALGRHAPTALLVIAAIGFVDGTTDVIFDTLIQREADPRRYGAVFGLASASFTTTMLLAVTLAPLANRYLEPRAVLLTASLFLVGAGSVALLRTRSRIGSFRAEMPLPARIEVGSIDAWSSKQPGIFNR
jgi:DHA3 family macrolide efflux protein-like MFS transporter